MSNQKLILLRGCPGSGKSTLAQWLCGEYQYIEFIEADRYFMDDGVYKFDASMLHQAHKWCQTKTAECLAIGLSVIVSNTSTTEKEVAVYQQMAKDFGVDFVSLIAENRHNGVNTHGVPEEKLQQMKQRFSVKL